MESSSAATTRLAEQWPQIESPLRIDVPTDMKAPTRATRESRDSILRTVAYSPHAFVARQLVLHAISLTPHINRDALCNEIRRRAIARDRHVAIFEATSSSVHAKVAQQVTLAKSALRAKRMRSAAQAYFAAGVLYDNAKLLRDAASTYRKFLDVATKMDDHVLCALAYNSIGVNCMLIAAPPGFPITEPALVHKAIDFHDKHLRIADDGGQFVAHTNLGLCFTWLDDALAAARHYQDALRLAIQLQSQSGQSIAVGNLGALALARSDLATAKPCLDQHLKLVASDPIGDADAHIYALMLLGKLDMKRELYAEAAHYFEAAVHVSTDHNRRGMLRRCQCLLGRARALLRLPAFCTHVHDSIAQAATVLSAQHVTAPAPSPVEHSNMEQPPVPAGDLATFVFAATTHEKRPASVPDTPAV